MLFGGNINMTQRIKPKKNDYISYILENQYTIKKQYKLRQLGFMNVTALEVIADDIKKKLKTIDSFWKNKKKVNKK